MKTLQEIRRILTEHKEELRRKYRVKEIGVFGSFVKGGQRKGSDVDILVEFEEPPSLFVFMDLEEYLSKLLGLKIDLVTKKALKPRIGKRILEEAVYL
ncbi:MAG: nucleotidyltransferase family protein [Thermoproteota archaeon]